MKAKRFLFVLVLVLITLFGVSAKEITNWWSGYTKIDDFEFGKVNAFFRAWEYDDGSRVYITVYANTEETRVRYTNADLGNKARVPFVQITEVSSNGVRAEYNLVSYPEKFTDFQFTLYSADEKAAEFSFRGTVNVFGSEVGLISDRVVKDFNKSDSASVSDITIVAQTVEKKETNGKSDLDKGIEFLQWLFSEPEPEHPDGTKICSYCHGDAKCAYCKGSGKDPSGFLSYCSKCDFMGNGICSICHGKGWTY